MNTKHTSIKFKYKISQSSIPFLDMGVYIKNNKLYTKIYTKEIDRQNFLHINSEHPISLKNSSPYSQVLREKWTGSRQNKNLKEFIGSNKVKKKSKNTETKTGQIPPMSDKFKVTLL